MISWREIKVGVSKQNKGNNTSRISVEDIEDNELDQSTPTMVFSVIGDSDNLVPSPWPKTVFQTALIEAAKSGGGNVSTNLETLHLIPIKEKRNVTITNAVNM